MQVAAQQSFDFGETFSERPKNAERLFFAILLDAVTAHQVNRAGHRFVTAKGLAGRLHEPERLHISLHHVADLPRLRSKPIYAAGLAAAAVSQRPFEVTLNVIKSFGGIPRRGLRRLQYPLILPAESASLASFQARLGTAMVGTGLRASGHVVPHITLLYGDAPVAAEAIEPISFTVRDFVLVHSLRGLSRYELIGRWPLRA
ncbi:2'-5' RNA ligase family protein [Methylovirgula sp. 4M-Z18]|uniref:2'-5' RNA ligase family protein n=1 Tax=Methylovirgula sp. 4M-Z18 TaxID=2293567 RepID=UPI0013146CFC|nr:2'-5' RNA ligase family protein [Methylovirgula sp. 4M-Z18]